MLTGTSKEPQAWEGITKEKLWPKVCEIGGTVVTMNSAAAGRYSLTGVPRMRFTNGCPRRSVCGPGIPRGL